jgi:hypothetical protein
MQYRGDTEPTVRGSVRSIAELRMRPAPLGSHLHRKR